MDRRYTDAAIGGCCKGVVVKTRLLKPCSYDEDVEQ